MRVILTIFGAIVGMGLASGLHVLLGLLLGAFAGYALVELSLLRSQLRELQQELGALRKVIAQRPEPDAVRREGTGARESVSGWSAAAQPTPAASAPGTATPVAAASAVAVRAADSDEGRVPRTGGRI
jgi:hypothetical protein